jgi:hypothetical protein
MVPLCRGLIPSILAPVQASFRFQTTGNADGGISQWGYNWGCHFEEYQRYKEAKQLELYLLYQCLISHLGA